MNGAVFKNIFREIWQTKARFISILTIIGLGVGFFVGVKAASPSMMNTMKNYAHEQNMMDFRLVSTVGFDDDDVSAIKKTKGIAQAQAGYFTDAVMSDGNKKSVVRLHSLSEDDRINMPLLNEGRLPQKSGEIVVEDAAYASAIEIGEKIKFDKTVKSRTSGKDEDIPLECTEYTVVGKVKSPLYISFQKGKTTIGNGTISYYMMILPQDFSGERYTELFLLSDYSVDGGDPFASEYGEETDSIKTRLESACDKRLEVFDKNELEPEREKLSDGKKQLEKAKRESDKKLSEASEQIEALKKQYKQLVLPSGNTALIEQMKKQIDDAEKQYSESKEKAEKELNDKQQEIKDGEAELEQFDDMTSYVFTRDENPGYSEFEDNAGRVDAVATVFPVFFLLVAVLVCVTTMTRMVEERRTEIGTFKALGYSNSSIILKYVLYSTAAGIIGCVLGCIIGCATLPRIIFNAYAMLYYIKPMDAVIPWGYIVGGFVVAILCTALVSWFTCRQELLQRPAGLMRPTTPKAGKINILEKIGFIWKRMRFTSKVTARNIFRYKARFFMTVIGVAGCTALILAAFGLMDSIGGIVDKQFGEINQYNLSIVFSEKKTAGQAKDFIENVKEEYELKNSMPVFQDEITVKNKNNDGKAYEDTFLVVPSSPKNFRTTVDLHSRQTGSSIELNDDGCVMSEKLAANMGLKTGDSFKVEDSDGQKAELKLSAICENYLYNYIYITPDCYKDAFGTDVKYNMINTSFDYTSDEEKDSLASELLKNEDIVTVNYAESGIDNFRKMMSTLNMVVCVMIISAGALAFVVLYNLTNINIAERAREIATIKVLGFYNREVSEYIYRENIILTVIGTLFGLLLGVFLNSFIIKTVEVDIVMFGREIMPQSFFYAVGLTLLFAVTVNFFMYFKMRRIDMVESLKSIE